MRTVVCGLLTGFTIFAVLLMASPAAPPPPQGQDQTAQSWSGTLVDADCKAADPAKACEVSGSTKAFALDTSGQLVKIQSASNSKVMAKMRNARKTGASANVEITGRLEAGEIVVQSISMH